LAVHPAKIAGRRAAAGAVLVLAVAGPASAEELHLPDLSVVAP
jgi:dihydroxyacetone kinase